MKGIEPVIAVVILVAISIAVAGMLYTWYQGTLQMQQRAAQSSIECTFASLEIESVFISPSGGRAVVKNTGQRPVEISMILVEAAESIETFPMNSTLEKLSFASLPFAFSAACEDFVSLTVYTACSGVSARFKGNPVCK